MTAAVAPRISNVGVARWIAAGVLLLAASALIIAAYYATVASAVHLWLTRDTYSYAFAILPIVAFLVWQKRDALVREPPAPAFGNAFIVLAFSAVWIAGAKLEVLEIQHLAIPGILAGLVVCALGWPAARLLWLPLCYLFLLAPVGTPLLPFLQSVTAWLATTFLSIGQIPFYAEGVDIEAATGRYTVAPGCAGLNFILASATVVPLFCEIMYRSFRKKALAFAVMMAIVPIANGVRVFGIIAIAEYSHRTIDIAADHLLYGWMFFSVVLLAMFWVGSRFADPPLPAPAAISWPSADAFAMLRRDREFFWLAIVVAAVATIALLAPALYTLTSH